MLTPFTHCKIHRTSDQSEIIPILEQNPVKTQFFGGILIGSRAARHFLPNFRGISEDNNADYDIISSSHFLLSWLREKDKDLNSIDMIIATSKDDDELDLSIYCTLHDGSKYDFVIPRSPTSYTAYILDHSDTWIKNEYRLNRWRAENHPIHTASAKLLLILKKYMLYYSHQWEKTAKDYRQLLTVTDPLTDEDMVLCDLFVRYNEKIHGKRPLDTNEFVIDPTDTREEIIIKRDEFFQYEIVKRISFIYKIAMSLSIAGDILIGLEYICIRGPLWLADYVINNWIAIHQEKYKQKFQLSSSRIQFELENYRLFPQVPEIATKRILQFITDSADFYSMQHVCKRWYTILREEIFWRDLYISRYGAYSDNVNNIKSWKMLYLVRLEGKIANNNNNNNKILEQLVDATIQLRQYTVNNVLQLWEDLTHQDQPIDSVILYKINYILSNSFYYQVEKTSDHYSVKLIINGLDHGRSQSKIHLNLRVGEYGSSRFTTHMEQLSIQYDSNDNEQRSLTFLGPTLLGFYPGKWGYVREENTLLSQTSSTISNQYPSGLLICLFIMMTHPDHRAQFIKYLTSLECRCVGSLSCMGY